MNALTFGRYNICTTAHIHTFEKILEKFESLTVGIIKKEVRNSSSETKSVIEKDFYKLADAQHAKTSFSLNERVQLMDLSLKDRGLSSVSIVTMSRPECDVVHFNNSFPPSEYRLIFPRPVGGQSQIFDVTRDRALAIILEREVSFIDTTLTIHTSEIVETMKLEAEKFSEFMTPSALAYFISINGPERILDE